MAYRYLMKDALETGGVLLPDDWNMRNAEYAQEMNGYLDRDNLGEGWFDTTETADKVFHEVLHTNWTHSGTSAKTKTTGANWRSDVKGGQTSMPSFSPDTTTDALCRVEFGGSLGFTMNDATTKIADTSTAADGDSVIEATFWSSCIQFRITVDGIEVGRTGWISDEYRKSSPYVLGVIPLPAGQHTIKCEYRVAEVGYRQGNEYTQRLWTALDASSTAPEFWRWNAQCILTYR
jgi:hypothetical protein